MQRFISTHYGTVHWPSYFLHLIPVLQGPFGTSWKCLCFLQHLSRCFKLLIPLRCLDISTLSDIENTSIYGDFRDPKRISRLGYIYNSMFNFLYYNFLLSCVLVSLTSRHDIFIVYQTHCKEVFVSLCLS
jgi:hypothetical protein